MKTHSSGFYIGMVVTIILGFGLVTLIAFAFHNSDVGGGASTAPVLKAKITGPGTAELDLATYPDSMVCHADAAAQNQTWVTYCAGNNDAVNQIELPPNSLITVNISQYDSGTTLINDYFAQVRGTTATLDGQPFSNISDVSTIQKAVKGGHTFSPDPGHTFTIQSVPNSTSPIFVSVPLIGVNSNAPATVNINGNMYPVPNVISFTFRTGPAGMTYLWHCYDPCGDTQYGRNPPFGFSGPMWTLGYMAGTITVTNY